MRMSSLTGRGSDESDQKAEPCFHAARLGSSSGAVEKKGGLDLTALKPDFADAENFGRWVKVNDRIERGEMPPKKKERPPADESAAFLKQLGASLVAAEKAKLGGESRTRIRRLTRSEYENTMRDLFEMPGVALAGDLPPDGSAHGFDNNADALDISHVNLAKYVEAADKTLDLAIATSSRPSKRERLCSMKYSNSAPNLSACPCLPRHSPTIGICLS